MVAAILVVGAVDLWNAVRVEIRADSFIIFIGLFHFDGIIAIPILQIRKLRLSEVQ